MRVYIAGPYTKGDVGQNVRQAVHAADQLLVLGHWPYLPHLSHFWHLVSPKDYEDWLQMGLVWVAVCHCVVRLEGDSAGADREVAYARERGIPVCEGVEEFFRVYHAVSARESFANDHHAGGDR